MQNGGVAGTMGLHPVPMGTLDELKAEGLNPALVGSCHAGGPGIKGCEHYSRCIFRLTRNGGFRDKGPKNVGYYLRTHDNVKVENECSCHFFMAKMYPRMRDGQRDREDGKHGELIQIIAFEPGISAPDIRDGEKIHKTTTRNLNEGTQQVAVWKKVVDTKTVSPFLRPGDITDVTYEAILEDRRKLREMGSEEMNEGPQRVSPAEVEAEPEYVDTDVKAPEEAPVVETGKSIPGPVGRGRRA